MVESSDKYRQIAEVLIAIPRFLNREKIRQLGAEGISSIIELITNHPDDHTLRLIDERRGYRCSVCGRLKGLSYFGEHHDGKEASHRVCRYCCWRIKTKVDEVYRQKRGLPARPQSETLSRLNQEQRDSLESFLSYRATNAPNENEPRIRLPSDAYERPGYYGPNFANISSGWFQTTKDEPYRTNRCEYQSWWTSKHDEVLEWFLQSYGMFASAAENDIKLEIKRLWGMKQSIRGYFCYFLLDRICTETHLWNLYASDYGTRYKDSHSCQTCGAHESLVDIHPENVAATFGRVLPLCNLHWKTYLRTVGGEESRKGSLSPEFTDLDSVLGEYTCPICNKTHSWRDRTYTYTPGFYSIPKTHREICFTCLDTAINRQPRSYATKRDLEGVLEISQSLCELPDDNMYHVVIRQAQTLEVAASIVQRMQSMVRFDTLKRKFGSWFAVLSRAGCLPEGCRRENFGTRILAKDGHECRSIAEMTIDDALFRLNIPHRKEVRYPNAGFICDWVITRGDSIVFIEYFGLSGKEAYDEKIVQKRVALSKAGIELVELYYEDLERIEAQLLKFAPIQKDSGTKRRDKRARTGSSAGKRTH